MTDSPADAARRRDLVRMRAVATGLLVVAAILYALSLRQTRAGWLGWVNAGSEAAMVGALADWFAVTAIFRHPLGIPVPHTALVKRRKNELGRSLQEFVTGNFLTREVVTGRLAEAQVALRVARWLESTQNRERLLAQVARGASRGLGRITSDDVEALVTRTVVPRLRERQVGPVAGALLADVVRDGSHQQAVDVLARELYAWLEAHPEAARRVIGERAPSWTPAWLDKQVVDLGYRQALEWVMAVQVQPQHPFRLAVSGYLARVADDLKHDEQMQARASRLWNQVLDNPSIAPAVDDLWQTVRESVVVALDDRSSELWAHADRWVAEAAARLADDDELRARVDGRVADVAAFLVDTYGHELASVITTTVDRWDADEASDRIELFVGRDLQFIRINGTVVGCLAGLLIHALGLLV